MGQYIPIKLFCQYRNIMSKNTHYQLFCFEAELGSLQSYNIYTASMYNPIS